MPRPSLKAERTAAILDAVETCMIRYGVHGTTLENVAEAAGLARSLLRHNVGNRDEMMAACLDRFFASSDAQVAAMLASLPETGRMPALLDLLFDDQKGSRHLALVALSLTAAAASDKDIARRLSQWNRDFIRMMAGEVRRSFPGAAARDCHDVAAGLTGMYFNTESLAPLGKLKAIRQASKRAAGRLIDSLAR